jgi:hypothetical protein
MIGIARITKGDREADFEAMRGEILGELPKGPYEFSKDLNFDDYKPEKSDVEIIKRFKHAVRRDCRYGSANGFYVRLYGMSQTMRHIYDGGRQMIDGGMK